MKKKILFALAMPALLAACTNEEIVDVQSSDMKEVVGADLVAKGLTINFGEDALSRMTATGQFDDEDKLGLGWVTKTGPSTTQSSTVAPDDERLYANHLFVKDGEGDGVFTTWSNVYQGWHFAYYPYTRMAKVGQMEITNINPAMTKEYKYENGTKAEFMENRFHISARDFISSSDVNENNALVGKKFNLLPMVSTFTVVANVAQDILDEADLASLKITKLELNAGKNMLYGGAKLYPQYLPQNKYADFNPNDNVVKLEYDKDKTVKQMTVANLFGSNKAISKTDKKTTLSTDINVESYKLDGAKYLRMNILPIDASDLYAEANPSSVTLKVYVEGGYFTVKYTAPKKDSAGNSIAYTAAETANNTAISKLASLLSEAGYKTMVDGKEKYVNWSDLISNQGVQVSLAKENFTADYTGIKNVSQWNGCVKVANALGETKEVTFVLDQEADVVFPDTDGEIKTPTCGVKVDGNGKSPKITIDGNVTWPSNISGFWNGCQLTVKKNAELTVNNRMGGTSIINKGTIKVGSTADISDATNRRLNNKEGRVVIEYGAFVYPSNGNEGIIAYNVDGTESAAKINTLIATGGSQNGYANVNTLIIADNVTLNLTKKDGDDVDNDRYHGSTQVGSELADMTNVAIEMNGGSIIAALNKVKNVHNVTIKGGDNTIKDVDVMGTLQVEAGSVTIDATEYTVEKTDANGQKVYVNVKNAADVNAIDVKSDATLNVAVDTYTSTINNDGKINVTKPYVLRYADSIEQSGDQSGYIVQGSINLAEAVAKGGDITLMDDCDLTEILTIAANSDVEIDLNGKTVSGGIQLEAGATLTVENGTIENTDSKISGIESQGGALTLDGVKITSARHAVRAKGGNVVINGGTYKVSYSEGMTQHALNVSDGATVTINGGTFVGPKENTESDSGAAVNVQAGSTVIIYGGDFSGGKNNTLASKGTLTVCGGTFDQDPSQYVPKVGYNVNQTDGKWIVSKE